MSLSHTQYLEILNEFEALPKEVQSESIFDIAGYPHYENVASNILAFFLNPNNEHGLGELLLSSLLNLADASETNQSNIQVNREVYTIGGGRLDIVIETDDQLIGIENKIYHLLINDLEDYGKSLDGWAAQNQLTTVKIILGIRKERESFGFVSITYEELFAKIKERLGSYATTSSQKWLLYLIDFMNSIEKQAGGDMEFDENDNFFIENWDRVDLLINTRNRFLSKFDANFNPKLIKLQEEIEKPDACEKQWMYSKLCLVHDFNLSGNSIAFDLHAYPTGWKLELFGRNQLSTNYVIQLISKRRDQITMEKGRIVVQKWPLSTELSKIKEKLCEWMAWIVQEDAKKSQNTDAV